MKLRQHRLKGVYTDGKRFYTRSLAQGESFFDERTVKHEGMEYRHWEPRKSKLAAAIMKGAKDTGLEPGQTVLYLGASHGYTPSFVSDILGEEGFVFALDFAPRVVRDLVFMCRARQNMAPIIADARKPETYFHMAGAADYIYQDIAQKDQAEIFLKNCRLFLKPGSAAFVAVKSRSIDMSKKPRAVFDDVRKKLERELDIVDYRVLEPFEKDHCVFVCRKE